MSSSTNYRLFQRRLFPTNHLAGTSKPNITATNLQQKNPNKSWT